MRDPTNDRTLRAQLNRRARGFDFPGDRPLPAFVFEKLGPLGPTAGFYWLVSRPDAALFAVSFDQERARRHSCRVRPVVAPRFALRRAVPAQCILQGCAWRPRPEEYARLCSGYPIKPSSAFHTRN